jgi:hypothetical protein
MVKGNTVKIDEELLERVKKLIKTNSKKIKYSTLKQFVNISVLELLEKEEKSVK